MTKYEKYTLADVKQASAKELFTVISTFAGGGGSSTGYRLAGGKVLAINEFVAEAIETYKANYPETIILPGDIKTLSGDDFLAAVELLPGQLDILDGSPPCSAFSPAGKREKGWEGYVDDTTEAYFDDEGELVYSGEVSIGDGKKLYSDGKKVEAIEDLFLEFIRIAKDIQPKVIIAENVKGITMGGAKVKLNQFLNAFEAIGYITTYKVISAADYGVPQTRERCIIVSVREDVADEVGINCLNIHGIVFPIPTTPKWISVRSAIEDVVNDPEQEKELEEYVQNGFQKKWIEMLPFNPIRHMKPSDIEFIAINPKRSLFNMIRPCPDLPSPTITQRGNQKSVSGVFHYAKNRKFTVPELIRVMGMPEDYILTGGFDKSAERLGRMHAPKPVAAIATQIYNNVLKPYKEINGR